MVRKSCDREGIHTCFQLKLIRIDWVVIRKKKKSRGTNKLKDELECIDACVTKPQIFGFWLSQKVNASWYILNSCDFSYHLLEYQYLVFRQFECFYRLYDNRYLKVLFEVFYIHFFIVPIDQIHLLQTQMQITMFACVSIPKFSFCGAISALYFYQYSIEGNILLLLW